MLASDFGGIFEGLIWWGINGVYAVMLLIAAIGCIGRRATRANDDLTRSLVMGGIVLIFSVLLQAWSAWGSAVVQWQDIRFCVAVSGGLWILALLLRWYQQR